MFGAHRQQQRVELGEVDARLIGVLGHSQPAAHVDDLEPLEALCGTGQQARRMLPAGLVEDAAADVGLQAHDARAGLVRLAHELAQLPDRHAELRAGPGGTHVRVMPAADAGVEAREDVMAAKQLRPGAERIAVVDGYAHAARECPGVLIARGKVRRVENAPRLQIWKKLEQPLNLAARDALELDPLSAQRPQQLRVRVGLHRVVHPRERPECAQRARRAAHRLEVVHEGRLRIAERPEQLRALAAPPGHARRGDLLRLGEQLLPGRTQHTVVRHRADQQLVQLLDQAIALVLVDDEGEVEVVRRLAHQVNLLLLEELEGPSELMQDGADVAPDETHRSARPDHLHATQARQVRDQLREERVIECVGRRIKGYRDRGLRG